MFINTPKGCLSFHDEAIDTTHRPLLSGFDRWPDRRRISLIRPYAFVIHFLQGSARHP